MIDRIYKLPFAETSADVIIGENSNAWLCVFSDGCGETLKMFNGDSKVESMAGILGCRRLIECGIGTYC